MDVLEHRLKNFVTELTKQASERPFFALVEALNEKRDSVRKLGARHGVRDKTHLKAAHDAVAAMVDGVHCGEVGKAGARHSAEDLGRIKKVHDLLMELGALCPGTGPMGTEQDTREDDD